MVFMEDLSYVTALERCYEASKDKEEIIFADVDTEDNHLFRERGLFRDRRPELYKEILTLNGKIKD